MNINYDYNNYKLAYAAFGLSTSQLTRNNKKTLYMSKTRSHHYANGAKPELVRRTCHVHASPIPHTECGMISVFSFYFFIYCPSHFEVDFSMSGEVNFPPRVEVESDYIGTGASQHLTSSQSHRTIIPLPSNGNRMGKLRVRVHSRVG